MAEKLKELQAKVLEWWNRYTSKQKTAIVSGTVGIIFIFALFVYFVSQPQYVRFRTCATAAEASQIMDALEGAGYTVRITGGGLAIDIDETQVSQAEMTLGAEGLTEGAPDLSEVLSGGFSTTEADKQKLYVDYLQKELEVNFENYTAVKEAKVQINYPDQDGTLIAQKQEASCYILLDLKGNFTAENAANMAKAAAAKLGNDTTENIVIVDVDGNLLFSGENDYTAAGQATTYLELNDQAESYIKSKVTQALIMTGQFDMVAVAPYLKFDYSDYERVDHLYDVADGRTEGYLSHESGSESENSSGIGGVPGTDSNDENTYMWDDNSGTESSTSSFDKDYVLNETMLKTLTPAGIIDYNNSSITVTAITYNEVHEEIVRSQGLLDGGITWEEYKLENDVSTKMTVDEDFYNAVATATGIDASRITIVAYRENLFYDEEEEEINWNTILSIAMIVIILALLAFVILRSMRSNKEVEQEEELSVENLLQSTTMEPEVDSIDTETKSDVRKMIEKFVDDNPEAAANLLRNWLNEDWG
ncbi:MAG: flagellar M-ring protein FliF [Lachnospiraceae bacterium]|nr:flagellar M-ring protein FliF [Lachnospiraceae bacterium]